MRYEIELFSCLDSIEFTAFYQRICLSVKSRIPSIYFLRSNIDGDHLRICNFKNIEDANRIKIEILKKEKNRTRNLVIRVSRQKDTVKLNATQKKIYFFLENMFDDYLSKEYFSNYNFWKIVNFAIDIADSIPKEPNYCGIQVNGYVCHYSHLWAFLNSLNEEQLIGVKDLFKKAKVEFNKKKENLVIDTNFNKLLKKELSMFSEAISKNEINFFSPFDEDNLLLLNQWASKEHEMTMKNIDLRNFINKNSSLIIAKWNVNVLYEKLPLLKFSIFQKYILNYIVCSKKYKINQEIDQLINDKRCNL